MQEYYLAHQGDSCEKKYWDLFIRDQFKNYEDFWAKNVVLLTNRPTNIHFKTDEDLIEIGKTANDICIAQLHYSILRHLICVFDILSKENIDLDNLTDGMARLTGALDNAFELLERYQNPGKYDPWSEKKIKNRKLGSREARKAWQEANAYPLQKLRDYRNHLIHGRVLPGKLIKNVYCLPKIGTEKKYFDWRKITDPLNNAGLDQDDLLPIKNILFFSWTETLKYLNNQWEDVLLK